MRIACEIGSTTLFGTLDGDRAPIAASLLAGALPIQGVAIQDSWSGEVVRLRSGKTAPPPPGDRPAWFMHPGLLGVDANDGQLVLGYGQGRLSDGRGPIPMIPVAELSGEMDALLEWGVEIDRRGASPITLRIAGEGERASASEEGVGIGGRVIDVSLGSARAKALLLDNAAPHTCASLLRRLPLVGTATNTIASGPLLRFWNEAGGSNGETPLEDRDDQYVMSIIENSSARTRVGVGITMLGDATQGILYPGYLYYLPQRPWRGIRIAAVEATRMGGGQLVPFARFLGDWSELRATAEELPVTGARPMTFTAAVTP